MMDFSPVISEEDKNKISELFKTMNLTPATESDKLAKDWIKTHENHFSGFVNGSWLPKSDDATIYDVCNPFSLDHYAQISIASETVVLDAAKNSDKGHNEWLHMSKMQRSECLYKMAEIIEKNKELFALVESISSGKHLYRTQSKDVPNLIQSLNHYASYANTEDSSWTDQFTGVTCVIAEEFNEPTLAVSWRIGSVLAAKQVVLLLVDVKSCLSAFLLAELCTLSGLPPGVLNVLPIQQDKAISLHMLCNEINRIIFTGSYLRSKQYIKMAAEEDGMLIEVLISQRPVVIVYDSADLHSAADSVLEHLFYSDSRSERSGCKVLVHAAIQKQFHQLLEDKFAKISVGSSLSTADISCVVIEEQLKQLSSTIKKAKEQKFKVVQGPEVDPGKKLLRPTLICNLPTTSKLLYETRGGPLVVTVIFRSVKESIEMFNHNKEGTDVSVWTEKLPVALEVSHKLKTGNIWINSQNLFDTSAVYSSVGLGNDSSEGGKMAIINHIYVLPAHVDENQCYGTEPSDCISFKNDTSIKHNYELYIGGSYKKSSGNAYKIVCNSKAESYAYIADGTPSDIASAVSSAAGAQPKWESHGKFKRSQAMRKAGRTLNAKKPEFITMMCDLTGEDEAACIKKLDLLIYLLHFWSSYSVTSKGSDDLLPKTSVYGKVLQERYPLGVIGIQCNDAFKLDFSSFVQLVVPAITYGNAVVVVPTEQDPILALKMCEIFQSSGVLAGVVNVVTGCQSFLTRHLSFNMGLDAMWCSVDGLAFACHSSSIHPKRVFGARILEDLESNDVAQILITQSTYTKTTYMPMGTIFT